MHHIGRALVLAMWNDVINNSNSSEKMETAAKRTTLIFDKLGPEDSFAHAALLSEIMISDEIHKGSQIGNQYKQVPKTIGSRGLLDAFKTLRPHTRVGKLVRVQIPG